MAPLLEEAVQGDFAARGYYALDIGVEMKNKEQKVYAFHMPSLAPSLSPLLLRALQLLI